MSGPSTDRAEAATAPAVPDRIVDACCLIWRAGLLHVPATDIGTLVAIDDLMQHLAPGLTPEQIARIKSYVARFPQSRTQP